MRFLLALLLALSTQLSTAAEAPALADDPIVEQRLIAIRRPALSGLPKRVTRGLARRTGQRLAP